MTVLNIKLAYEDKLDYNNDNIECKYCNHECNLHNGSCYLCYVVSNIKKNNTSHIFLINSTIDQKDINKKINEYFETNNKILKPLDIDKSALLIDMSVWRFTNLYNKMDTKEKKHFSNFKIFFTNQIINKLKIKSIFIDTKIEYNYDISYFNLNSYTFTKKQLEIIMRYDTELI